MLNFPISIGHVLRLRFSRVLAVDSPSFLSSTAHSVVSSKDYLETSLRLSPESKSALKSIKTKPVFIKSTSNADSVIALFKDHGFGHTQVAKILSFRPRLLTCNPLTVLNPKLHFLSQSSISHHTLIHFITNNPSILERSLRRQIAPCVYFLEALFKKNHQALDSFLLHNQASLIFRLFSENTPVNVETLRRHGVPESSIVRLLLLGGGPACLAHETEYFNTSLQEIKDLGFDLSGGVFPDGFRVYCGMSKEKWVSKMEVIKEFFGWSDDKRVLALFVRQPSFMKLSLKNLRKSLDFFMKRLGWTPEYMATYSHLLASSLEKKILPRISVMEVLMSKGLVKEINMGSAFTISEDRFLSVFVNRYQKDIPEIKLMDIYTNSMQNLDSVGSR